MTNHKLTYKMEVYQIKIKLYASLPLGSERLEKGVLFNPSGEGKNVEVKKQKKRVYYD